MLHKSLEPLLGILVAISKLILDKRSVGKIATISKKKNSPTNCSCDTLNAEGKLFFAAEKPNHPFTKTIERIATKIEHQKLQYESFLTAT